MCSHLVACVIRSSKGSNWYIFSNQNVTRLPEVPEFQLNFNKIRFLLRIYDFFKFELKKVFYEVLNQLSYET